MRPTDEFLIWFRDKRGATRSTLDKYRLVLGVFAEMFDPATATVEDVETFTGRARKGGLPAAAATVAVELAVLASFYRWAQARLGWTVNPATLAGRAKVHNRQPRPITDDLWLSVWRTPLPLDARVALGLGFFCGLRRMEIMSLRGEQVWGGALVNFQRKGGGEDRLDVTDLLAHWQAFTPHLRPDLFAEPLARLAAEAGPNRLMPWDSARPQALNKRWHRWLERAGVAPDAFGPHNLRHSFATNLLGSGVPLALVTDLCNHSSPTVTMRYIRTSGGRLALLRQPIIQTTRERTA